MPEHRYGYHGVNHPNYTSESCSVQTWNDHLGDLLTYLNAVVTFVFEHCDQCVCGLNLALSKHLLYSYQIEALVPNGSLLQQRLLTRGLKGFKI